MPVTFSKMIADINMSGAENSAKNNGKADIFLEPHIESYSYQRSPNGMIIKFVQYDLNQIQYIVST